MASVGLNATSAILSLTSFTFFLIGCIGYSNENTTVENVNWFWSRDWDNVENHNLYVGLSRLTIENAGSDTASYPYSSKGCSLNFCDACEKHGENAFALLVIAVVFSFITTLLTIGASAAPSAGLSGGALSTAFVSCLFGVVGWSLFVNKCFRKIVRNDIVGANDFDYGPGAILTLIAFLLAFIVMILQIVSTAIAPASSNPTPVENKSEAVATNEL